MEILFSICCFPAKLMLCLPLLHCFSTGSCFWPHAVVPDNISLKQVHSESCLISGRLSRILFRSPKTRIHLCRFTPAKMKQNTQSANLRLTWAVYPTLHGFREQPITLNSRKCLKNYCVAIILIFIAPCTNWVRHFSPYVIMSNICSVLLETVLT